MEIFLMVINIRRIYIQNSRELARTSDYLWLPISFYSPDLLEFYGDCARHADHKAREPDSLPGIAFAQCLSDEQIHVVFTHTPS